MPKAGRDLIVCSLLIIVTLAVSTANAAPQRVVFCGFKNDKKHLFVANLDGGGLKQITTSPAEDTDPVWSQDGSTILFIRIPGHKKGEIRSDGHLWRVRADGTGLQRLTWGPTFDTFECWLEGGKAFTFYRQGQKPGFYRYDLGSRKITSAKLGDIYGMSSSPNGKWIAYIKPETEMEDEHRADLWLASASTRRGRRLTRFKSSFSRPEWSPGGENFVVTAEVGPGGKLCIVSVPSGQLRTLVQGSGLYFEDPRWSPDGKRLAFLQSNQALEPMTNASFRQLYVMSVDGSGKKRLTDHWGNDYSPQWTRDGKSILIQGERGLKGVNGGVMGTPISQILLVDASGKGERVLSLGIDAYSPVLSP